MTDPDLGSEGEGESRRLIKNPWAAAQSVPEWITLFPSLPHFPRLDQERAGHRGYSLFAPGYSVNYPKNSHAGMPVIHRLVEVREEGAELESMS
jgi:hypothetical protein